MAIWQYTFHVIPKCDLEKFYELREGLIDEELFDDAIFWKGTHVKPEAFKDIGDVLPKVKSWSNSIIQYGHLESNCFEVLHNMGFAESVSFRIDYTSEYEPILAYLLDFTLLNGFSILDEDWQLVDDTLQSVKNIIENSSQKNIYKRLSGEADSRGLKFLGDLTNLAQKMRPNRLMVHDGYDGWSYGCPIDPTYISIETGCAILAIAEQSGIENPLQLLMNGMSHIMYTERKDQLYFATNSSRIMGFYNPDVCVYRKKSKNQMTVSFNLTTFFS